MSFLKKLVFMPLPHLLVTLFLICIWGVNFVVIQVALQELPPILLTFLRFFFATFPAVFFFKRPNTSWKLLFYYSFSLIILDFCFLFTGMYIGTHFGRQLKFNMNTVGGIILIAIGSKILLEHTLLGAASLG